MVGMSWKPRITDDYDPKSLTGDAILIRRKAEGEGVRTQLQRTMAVHSRRHTAMAQPPDRLET